MGYMGFGMRKEVYERKPKKLSGNLIYASNNGKHQKRINSELLKKEHAKYTPFNFPLALKIFRLLLYKVLPLAALVWVIYELFLLVKGQIK